MVGGDHRLPPALLGIDDDVAAAVQRQVGAGGIAVPHSILGQRAGIFDAARADIFERTAVLLQVKNEQTEGITLIDVEPEGVGQLAFTDELESGALCV